MTLPDTAGKAEEAEMMTRSALYMETYADFLKKNCNLEGNQKVNLTFKQRKGLRSLLKQIKAGELVVCKSDKSGKLVVLATEIYKKMGLVHVGDDRLIHYKDTKRIKKILNAHTS